MASNEKAIGPRRKKEALTGVIMQALNIGIGRTHLDLFVSCLRLSRKHIIG